MNFKQNSLFKRNTELEEEQEVISSKYSTLMVEGGNDEVKQQVNRNREWRGERKAGNPANA